MTKTITAPADDILAGLDDSEAVRKLTEAQALLEKHYQQIGWKDGTPATAASSFVTTLVGMGGTTAQRLASLSYEDIQKAYYKPYESVTVPIFLNRDIAKIFRAGVATVTNEPEPIGRKKAAAMSPAELVSVYAPKRPGPVHDQLKDLSKGHPFIIVDASGSVIVEPTVKLLNELIDGFAPRKAFSYGEEVYEPMTVGQLPSQMADENPLYPDRPLRPDGTCDQTNRSWENISLEIRQFCRIAWGGKITSISEAHVILDRVISATTQPTNKQIPYLHNYALAGAAEFTAARKNGTLPKLKIPLRAINASSFSIQGKKV